HRALSLFGDLVGSLRRSGSQSLERLVIFCHSRIPINPVTERKLFIAWVGYPKARDQNLPRTRIHKQLVFSVLTGDPQRPFGHPTIPNWRAIRERVIPFNY